MVLSYILRTGTGWMDGRDVYSVASRVFLTHVFDDGRHFPDDLWQPIVPTSGLEGDVDESFVEVGAPR